MDRSCAGRSGGNRGRAARTTYPSLAKLTSALLASASPSGSKSVSPDWNDRSQRRCPTQVADDQLRLQRGAGSSSRSSGMAWALAPWPINSGRSGIWLDRHAIEHHAFGVDQRQPVFVLPQRRRIPFDDVDHQGVGKPPRHARILDPAELEQPTANVADVDQRHGQWIFDRKRFRRPARRPSAECLGCSTYFTRKPASPTASPAARPACRESRARSMPHSRRRARTSRTPNRPSDWLRLA